MLSGPVNAISNPLSVPSPLQQAAKSTPTSKQTGATGTVEDKVTLTSTNKSADHDGDNS